MITQCDASVWCIQTCHTLFVMRPLMRLEASWKIPQNANIKCMMTSWYSFLMYRPTIRNNGVDGTLQSFVMKTYHWCMHWIKFQIKELKATPHATVNPSLVFSLSKPFDASCIRIKLMYIVLATRVPDDKSATFAYGFATNNQRDKLLKSMATLHIRLPESR